MNDPTGKIKKMIREVDEKWRTAYDKLTVENTRLKKKYKNLDRQNDEELALLKVVLKERDHFEDCLNSIGDQAKDLTAKLEEVKSICAATVLHSDPVKYMDAIIVIAKVIEFKNKCSNHSGEDVEHGAHCIHTFGNDGCTRCGYKMCKCS